MKTYTYGTKAYYEHRAEQAKLAETLTKEAIKARLDAGQITADQFAIYAEILQGVESDAEDTAKELAQFLAKEGGNND